MKPFRTATTPGGLPVEAPKPLTRSMAKKRPAEEAVVESAGPSSSQQRTQQSTSAANVPVEALHLANRLAPSVFMGRWVAFANTSTYFMCTKVRVVSKWHTCARPRYCAVGRGASML